MNIVSVYNDYLDRTAAEENGITTIEKFNRFSRLAELRLVDYLSGDVEGLKPPEPYSNQKLRDFLSILLKSDLLQSKDGKIEKPADYYRFDSNAVVGSYRDNVCGKDVVVSAGNTPIEILDGQQFDKRTMTYIKRLQPSMTRPIGKMVGKFIETAPVDLGTVKLYYVRYPVFGEIKTKLDTVYNEVVPDEAGSTNYEWDENVRNLLLYFLVQQFHVSTRENALAEQNELVNKSARR